jgi:prevent-host-death family protein
MNRPAGRASKDRTLALQDAKARFSEVVGAAMRGDPQHVTRRGKPAVVIVAAEDFERLSRAARMPEPTFIEHLLAIPKAPKAASSGDAPRVKIRPRDLDFST